MTTKHDYRPCILKHLLEKKHDSPFFSFGSYRCFVMKECCIALKSVLRGLGGTSGKKEPVENTEYMLQGNRQFLTRDTDQSRTRILAHQEILYHI